MEQEYAALNLRRVFALLRRNILPLLLCAVLGAECAALAVRYWLPQQYQASAQLLVDARADRTAPLTTEQIATAKELVNTYAVLLTNDALLESVINTWQMEKTVAQLQQRITAQAVAGTQVLRLAVRDEDPQLALAVLQSVVESAPAALAGFVGGGAVEVVSPPRLEEEPVRPGTAQMLLLGGGAGLVLCVVWLFIRSITSRRFASEQDVETHLGLPVLGRLPPVRGRARLAGVLCWQGEETPARYREDVGSLCSKLCILLEEQACKVLLVAAAAKREGKSSVAVNVALGLAQAGKRVLVLEGNLRAPALHTLLPSAPPAVLQDALQGTAPWADCVVFAEEFGFWIVPARAQPSPPPTLLGGPQLPELLAALAPQYDVILLDSPAAAPMADAAVLSRLADGVLLVVRQRGATFEQAARARRNLEAMGAAFLGVVYNEYDVYAEG